MNSIYNICKSLTSKITTKMVVRQSSDMKAFRYTLKECEKIVFITGTGISEESGLTTFSGPGYVWRNFPALTLAHPYAFGQCPDIYWEYYNYRRELAAKAQPNLAHIAIANYELKYGSTKKITTITQNIDNLHTRAGSVNLLELNGNLFKTRCTECDRVVFNGNRPIVPALANSGDPCVTANKIHLTKNDLPRCDCCGGLLRPHVVWFGESIDEDTRERASAAIRSCDMCIVVSEPSLVYPAITYPPLVARNGKIVAEFNKEPLKCSKPKYSFYFEGLASRMLPQALADKIKE